MWRVRMVFRRIKKIIDWIPVLWKEEDWDYCYIYHVLQYKLKRTRVLLEKNNRHTTTHLYVSQIRICELLLERLIKDDYIDIIDYRFSHFRSNHSFNIKRQYYILEDNLKKNDRELLFKIMSKHIECWWD